MSREKLWNVIRFMSYKRYSTLRETEQNNCAVRGFMVGKVNGYYTSIYTICSTINLILTIKMLSVIFDRKPYMTGHAVKEKESMMQ